MSRDRERDNDQLNDNHSLEQTESAHAKLRYNHITPGPAILRKSLFLVSSARFPLLKSLADWSTIIDLFWDFQGFGKHFGFLVILCLLSILFKLLGMWL